MTEQVFARIEWEKRFNHSDSTAYVGPAGEDRIFAVGITGSVTIEGTDVPHLVRHLRDLADTLERYYQNHYRHGVSHTLPARVRSRRRGGGEDR